MLMILNLQLHSYYNSKFLRRGSVIHMGRNSAYGYRWWIRVLITHTDMKSISNPKLPIRVCIIETDLDRSHQYEIWIWVSATHWHIHSAYRSWFFTPLKNSRHGHRLLTRLFQMEMTINYWYGYELFIWLSTLPIKINSSSSYQLGR